MRLAYPDAKDRMLYPFHLHLISHTEITRKKSFHAMSKKNSLVFPTAKRVGKRIAGFIFLGNNCYFVFTWFKHFIILTIIFVFCRGSDPTILAKDETSVRNMQCENKVVARGKS
jgi:hypothetical protein